MAETQALYLKQLELDPMQNFVYESEGGCAPLRNLPPGARAKPALDALRSGRLPRVIGRETSEP